jgi:hypothetical protein
MNTRKTCGLTGSDVENNCSMKLSRDILQRSSLKTSYAFLESLQRQVHRHAVDTDKV